MIARRSSRSDFRVEASNRRTFRLPFVPCDRSGDRADDHSVPLAPDPSSASRRTRTIIGGYPELSLSICEQLLPAGGWHVWTLIAASPVNPDGLIACGSNWSPMTNRLSGFLYASFDGGRSWQLKLTDSSTAWVSEESCTYGPKGRAYFIAGASKVFDGMTYHSLGETRVYSSNDSGRRWVLALKANRWIDHNAIASNVGRGPIFVIYNDIREHAQTMQSPTRNGARSESVATLEMHGRMVTFVGFPNRLPISVAGLPHRSGIALYGMAERLHASLPIEVLRIDSNGKPRPPFVQAMRVIPAEHCMPYPVMTQTSGDKGYSSELYVAAADAISGKCQIVLSRSSDQGRIWSDPIRRTLPDPDDHRSVSPTDRDFEFSMAANREGILGVTWTRGLDCWRFAASRDRGATFTSAVNLSDCKTVAGRSPLSSHYMLEAYAGDDRDGVRAMSSTIPAFSIRGGPGYIWRTSMVASADGAFHPVWMDVEEGEADFGRHQSA
jgi:hypothetical protein